MAEYPKKIATDNSIDAWAHKVDKSNKKCKRLKKRAKKLKARLKADKYGYSIDRDKAKKKLRKLKRALEYEKSHCADLARKVEQLQLEADAAEKELKHQIDMHKLQRQIACIQTGDQYEDWLLKIVVQEMLPGLIKKYGKVPQNSKIIDVEDYTVRDVETH